MATSSSPDADWLETTAVRTQTGSSVLATEQPRRFEATEGRDVLDGPVNDSF